MASMYCMAVYKFSRPVFIPQLPDGCNVGSLDRIYKAQSITSLTAVPFGKIKTSPVAVYACRDLATMEAITNDICYWHLYIHSL